MKEIKEIKELLAIAIRLFPNREITLRTVGYGYNETIWDGEKFICRFPKYKDYPFGVHYVGGSTEVKSDAEFETFLLNWKQNESNQPNP